MAEASRGGPRVLVTTANLGGGTGTHLTALLGQPALRDLEVRLLCYGEVEVEPPASVSVTERRTFGRLDRFPVAQVRRGVHMGRFVAKWRPELVHAYFYWPILYARLLKMRGLIPILVENREDEGFNLGRREYRLLRSTRHVPDRVVCVSNAVRRVVVEREGVPLERTRVLPNGVRLPGNGGSPVAEREVLAEFDIMSEHLVVGMVANLNRAVKGVRHLLDAVPRVRDEFPHVRFLIVGDGLDRRNLEAQARALGVTPWVVFTGFRPDVARLYRAMDVSVLTSLSEGLSITVLESMSHGLPVVATSVGGNPEVVRHEETGLLVPPEDPSAVAQALVRILGDPEERRAMGAAGRREVARRFALSRVADRYRQVYRELLAGAR